MDSADHIVRALSPSGAFRTKQFDLVPLPPSPGDQGTRVLAMNNKGDVLLQAFRSSGVRTYFVRNPDGRLTPVELGNLLWVHLTKTAIVGTINGTDRGVHGIIAEAPNYTVRQFDYPGSSLTFFYAANDQGDILGSFVDDAEGFEHAFLLDRTGALTEAPFSLFGARASMNNKNQVVALGGPFLTDAFFLDLTTPDVPPVPIVPPGAQFMSDLSINDRGAIAGAFFNDTGVNAFIRQPSGQFDITNHISIADINNAGQVAGWTFTIENNGSFDQFFFHGFLSTPELLDVQPMFQAASEWGRDLYANHKPDDGGTISKFGCALTSLTMAAQFAGAASIETPPCGDVLGLLPLTPRTANCLLRDSGGYDQQNNVLFDTATAVISEAAHPLLSLIYFGEDHSSITDPVGAQTFLDFALNDLALPAIVGVKLRLMKTRTGLELVPRHYILVSGSTTNSNGTIYYTRDPAGASPHPSLSGPPGTTSGSNTLDDYRFYIDCTATPGGRCCEDGGCSETDHPGTLVPISVPGFVTRGIVLDPVDQSSISVAVNSVGDLLVIAPDGRATGVDAAGDAVRDIPSSSHFVDSIDDEEAGQTSAATTRSVVIQQPMTGRYQIIVSGLTDGTYRVVANRIQADGRRQPDVVVEGSVFAGGTSTAEFTFDAIGVSDGDPPATQAILSSGPNSSGWNNGSVVLALTASDKAGGSGVRSIHYRLTGAENNESTVTGATATIEIHAEGVTNIDYFAEDNAGNKELPKTTVVRVDSTPPTIVGSRTPAPNASGWNNTDVTVGFSCVDATSGLASCGPTPVIISSEGAGQTVRATAIDLAGNVAVAEVSGINIDKTPPTATCHATPCVLWPPNHKMVPVDVTIDAADSGESHPQAVLAAASCNDGCDPVQDIAGAVPGSATPHLVVRAERSGAGAGRSYVFTYRVSDSAGNFVDAACTVEVPHTPKVVCSKGP